MRKLSDVKPLLPGRRYLRTCATYTFVTLLPLPAIHRRSGMKGYYMLRHPLPHCLSMQKTHLVILDFYMFFIIFAL